MCKKKETYREMSLFEEGKEEWRIFSRPPNAERRDPKGGINPIRFLS
jgi:hypothetical protein